MEEQRDLEGLTTCSRCIRLSLMLPSECKLDMDMLAARLKQLFDNGGLRGLCEGCPLERPRK